MKQSEREPQLKVSVVPVTAFQQNCSIVRCQRSGKGALVDPGGDIDRLLAAAQGMDVELEKILITHGHADHAGGTAALVQRLGLPVEGPHRDDQFLIDSLTEQAALFGLATAGPFTPSRFLQGGDEVTVGHTRFEVRHCPGHTPGHVVFYQAEEQLLFVGDVLFAGSIGRTDFPRGDHATLLRSIREQLLSLPDEVVFVPGHGPTSTIGRERRTNPFLA